jgi:hypothetical protein
MIAVIEANQSVLNSIAADPDVTRIATETNLETTVTAGNVPAVRTIFEAAFIPGLFINVGDTRREVIRGVIGMFLFSQRMWGKFGDGWKKQAQDAGMTLDSTWQEFPQPLKDAFITVRDSFGFTNEQLGLTNQSTMREALKAFSDQFEGKEIHIGGLVI